MTHETPFNGGYSRTDEVINGRPTYKSSTGYNAFWDGEAWTFEHSSVGMMAAIGTPGAGAQNYPDKCVDWTFVGLEQYYEKYYDVPIVCRGKF